MQAKIRWPKIRQFLLILLFLSAIPLTAEALQVQFCKPDCATATATNRVTKSETGTPVQNPTNVFTTTLALTGVSVGGFTVAGTSPKVVAVQSGTLQKITFSTMMIKAPTSGCTTLAPCSIEIIATSDPNDFPTRKPTGGYPSGVFLAGFFTGLQGALPNGDTISMTAEASGLSEAGAPLNSDVINATPGAGSGDTRVSLPSSCTGSPTCKFTATTALKSFNSQITETVQQKCDAGLLNCRTRLKTTLRISFKTNSNSVSLPAGLVTVDPPPPGQPNPEQPNPITQLIAETLPPFENLNVEYLRVSRNNTNFRLKATFTLDAGNSIDPAGEEVYLRIGSSFAITIPVGKFRRLSQGRRFSFVGTVDGLDVDASFERGSNPALWQFIVGVSRVKLTGLPEPPNQVSVDLAVGSDTGSDLVTASIFN